MIYKGWEGFNLGKWSNDEVDVRDFIQRNYTPYLGDGSFLKPATTATLKLWDEIMKLTKIEHDSLHVQQLNYQCKYFHHHYLRH